MFLPSLFCLFNFYVDIFISISTFGLWMWSIIIKEIRQTQSLHIFFLLNTWKLTEQIGGGSGNLQNQICVSTCWGDLRGILGLILINVSSIIVDNDTASCDNDGREVSPYQKTRHDPQKANKTKWEFVSVINHTHTTCQPLGDTRTSKLIGKRTNQL